MPTSGWRIVPADHIVIELTRSLLNIQVLAGGQEVGDIEIMYPKAKTLHRPFEWFRFFIHHICRTVIARDRICGAKG